jgi:hypothetical protein
VPGTLPNTFSGASFAGGFWSQPIAGDPAATDSAAIVSNVATQVADNYNGNASFNANTFTTTLYTVPAGEPTTTVQWNNCQKKSYTPSQLGGPDGWFTAVPIPAGAIASAGTDEEMTIWQPSSDSLWEFWKATQDDAGWHACWGGRMDSTTVSSPGYFADGGGATATGLPVAGGMVTLHDVRQGHIDHAMSLGVINARKYPALSYPAQRTDGGSTDTTTPYEGQRLRLDPTLDLSTLKLSAVGMMIAKAAQTYGFVVTDHSGAVSVYAEDGVPLQDSTGTNPWTTLLGGKATYTVLTGFPWSRLVALPVDYGKPS